ncbi:MULTISPECIES: DUF4159 domain-containing protein [unclassified Coleofasciculus]|uniref:DUF4159 domain-containing protein n=1 Tax=unclassified Coleofasciculus TaxID=2692782 RepID=UPI001881DA0E|nr:MULTISPECIES: DUF4159 domain-containing protein [unclassified Coleofasciculus]MBE9126972.1 DUF4159 domain-containing protein [Coleofasciculus sp. LEGE 07081]MBE9150345.1 DUF4159 domain-containing protein [Coleofasciculus sp. LEGE 07092]
MMKPWPPPSIKPFERLQVTDGLLIDAQRWQLAHQYHRQYHNAYYQSLHQPGIVCGLGVRIAAAPAEVLAKYRDERWVEIESGIAIDLYGNFIVVPEPMSYRISSEVRSGESLMIYLVVRFRDPDELRTRRTSERVTETFRIDERIDPPGDGDVEVCRILLKSGKVQLETPRDVFYPSYNNLDLRHRLQAQARPQALVQVAMYGKSALSPQALGLMGSAPRESQQSRIFANLSYLLRSVVGLYPPLQGSDEIGQLRLNSEELGKLLDFDLLFLTDYQFQSLGDSEVEVLRQYLLSGGVLLVEASTQGTPLDELGKVQQELEKAIAQTTEDPELQQHRQELQLELQAVKTDLTQNISQVTHGFQDLASALGTPLELLDQLDQNHPLRTQPFLFAALPQIDQQRIQILTGGGIIIAIGNLSTAWGLDENLSLPRETIRTAQEMGINILHFAWRRRQLTQWQRAVDTSTPPPTPPKEKQAKTSRRDKLFDKLI